jgi:hypothetical protein
MASSSAACRPSDPKRKKNLKQPELERAVNDCDFSYSSDLDAIVRAKVIQVRALKIAMIQGGKRLVLRDVGPKRHDFTVTSTKI